MHGETIFVPSGWFHQLTTSVYRLLRVELCAVEGSPDVEAQLSTVELCFATTFVRWRVAQLLKEVGSYKQ